MVFHDASILFDLDGTLIDTAPDLLNALNHTLAHADCSPVQREDINKLIGDGAKAMISAGLKMNDKTLSQNEESHLLNVFLLYYRDNIAVSSKLFEGVIDCLISLKRQNAKLAVCTNKMQDLSVKLLKELNLSDYFETIVGADTLNVRKPHPGHILGTIDLVKGNSRRAIMIGDSINDIKAAQGANIPVVAVNFGYSAQPVETYQPDAIIEHYNTLIPTISKLLSDL
ncbi:MAG: HAD-IA family hydrolase [Pseudomonadota bacterium]